jgi:protein phosphatase
MPEQIAIECWGQTDRGRERDINEDQFLVADMSKSLLVRQSSLSLEDQTRLLSGVQGKLLVVADGMGGHAAGDRASALAVETVVRYVLNIMPWFFRLDEQHEDDLRSELSAALERCQRTLEAHTKAVPRHHGMGTTLTMAYVLWPRMYVVHAGDSRCYLRRKDQLYQMTEDHTGAQLLVEKGDVDPREAKAGPMGQIVWNAIVADGRNRVSPVVYKSELALRDRLLLCTDGLTKHVPDRRIDEILAAEANSQVACQQLIDEALAQGGTDNITAVVARFGRS